VSQSEDQESTIIDASASGADVTAGDTGNTDPEQIQDSSVGSGAEPDVAGTDAPPKDGGDAAPSTAEIAKTADTPDEAEGESMTEESGSVVETDTENDAGSVPAPTDAEPAADEGVDPGPSGLEIESAQVPPDESDDSEKTAIEIADEALERRAADEGVSMMELLMEEGDFLPESLDRGDVILGTVIRKDDDQLILDVGAKREGVVPAGDVARLPSGFLASVKVGDELEVVVMRSPTRPEGDLLVSASQALSRKDWDNAKSLMDSGTILELDVVGHNKGGALVQFGALQGFVPKSHLVSQSRSDDSDSERSGHVPGSQIPVKVIEVNRRQRRLIMSERRAVREYRATQKEELLGGLQEGEVRRGRVSSVADFGIFVDLGGADGLVHVSELTHERGKHPRDIVKVGQDVEVYVLSLDRDRKRIGLSMKRLQQDPWSSAEADHYVGQIVDAVVTNLTKFGAFARLPSGLEGLIHISELADLHVEHPRESVRTGQNVAVEIISIDATRQRIGLSLRRVPEHLRIIDEAPPVPPESEPDSDSEETASVDVLDADAIVEESAALVVATEADESDVAPEATESGEPDDATETTETGESVEPGESAVIDDTAEVTEPAELEESIVAPETAETDLSNESEAPPASEASATESEAGGDPADEDTNPE
jgi:small subunit ribosomal protein S1